MRCLRDRLRQNGDMLQTLQSPRRTHVYNEDAVGRIYSVLSEAGHGG